MLVFAMVYSSMSIAETDDGVYVYEYAPKIDYHIMIGFVEIKHKEIVSDESYKIVLKVSKTGITVKAIGESVAQSNLSAESRAEGNVYVNGIKRLAYTKGNYAKRIPENRKKYYEAIDSEFLSLENIEKRSLIRSLLENIK